MATVVPADGIILDRVREALPLISSEGLSRQAYSKFDTALLKTAWARHHQREFEECSGGSDDEGDATDIGGAIPARR